jgi:hypothetical protein
MIEITPPSGWQPPPQDLSAQPEATEASTESPANSTNEPISSHFDDIDSVLNSAQTPSPVGPKKPNPKTNRAKPPATTPIRPLNQPILPTDQWTSRESQLRKKRLLQIAGLIGVLALSFVVLAATWNRFQTPASTTNTEFGNIESTPSELNAPNNTTTDSPSTSNPGLDPTHPDNIEPPMLRAPIEAPDPSPALPPKLPASTDRAATADLPTTDDAPPITPDASVPPTIATSPPQIHSNPPVGLPRSPIANRPPTADAPATKIDSANPLGNLENLQTQLGELSALLESSGTSLLQIQDLADANREEQLIGIPKYFIERPAAERIDIAKQLSLPCGGLRYTQTQLATVLRDLSTITGIPLALNADSVLAVSPSADPRIDIDIAAVDYDTAIESMLQPLGLTKSLSPSGAVVIHALEPDAFIEKKHTLPKFPQSEEPEAAHLVSAIQALFSPESWVQEPIPAVIELTDDEIAVHNTSLVQQQIADFIEKVDACIKLLTDPDDVDAKQRLTPKWNRIAKKLEQATGLKHTPDRLLVDLLAQIQQRTGVTVLVDWDQLLPLGWTPLTKVPGYMDEENLGEFLKQLTRSMKLTYRVVDDATVELTTFESAAESVELEVYHFGKLLTGPLNEAQAMRLIAETLGAQLQTPRVRYVYEPKYQSFVLLAPQSLQRQLAALIKKLEGL